MSSRYAIPLLFVAAGLLGAAPPVAPAPAPADAPPGIPEKYTGVWEGVSGKGEAKVTEKTGTATVTKDFGHEIKKFGFRVARDGRITGSGQAVYWFNITCDADLVALKRKYEAHLQGGNPTVDFQIEGQMSPDGRVRLSSKPGSRPTLVTEGKESPFDVWNVFGPKEQKVKQQDDTLLIEAVDTFPQINMRIAYTTAKNDCASLQEQIQFLQDKYIPFIQACIAAHQKFMDEGLWDLRNWPGQGLDRDADFNSLADQVLKEIQKTYKQAEVGAETTAGRGGNVETKVFKSDEPYPYVTDWRNQHEQYHKQNHFPKLPEGRTQRAYADYLKWRLQHEIDAYNQVNLKKAREKLEQLKDAYRRKPCGEPPPPAAPPNFPNSRRMTRGAVPAGVA